MLIVLIGLDSYRAVMVVASTGVRSEMYAVKDAVIVPDANLGFGPDRRSRSFTVDEGA